MEYELTNIAEAMIKLIMTPKDLLDEIIDGILRASNNLTIEPP